MKIHIHCLTAVALLCLMGQNTANAKNIKMVSVIYGTPEAGKICDATQQVASMCNGRAQCDVDVGNMSLCGDPDFLRVKTAVFDFACGRQTRRVIEGEYHVARVRCD